MSEQIAIDPELQKIPAHAMSSNRWMLAILNRLIQIMDVFAWKKVKGIYTRQTIAGLDGHRVPVWVVKPETWKTPGAALLYFHGGAFTLKAAPQHIANAVRYAREANCCVVFVDYRLAPKYPFPAGFNDCYSTLLWAHRNADELGIDKQRIAVGGDSAGGALAAGVAQKAAHDDGIPLCGQLLIYPVTDSDCETASSKAFMSTPPFQNAMVSVMWETYLGHAATAGVPAFASPLHGDLRNLAPAYVETSEFDILHDEGIAYANALLANGVNVVLNETLGTVHGYDLFEPQARLSRAAIDQRVQFLRRVFAS